MDDGAYILGALAPAERAAFEHHLAGCVPCREAVGQLAVLPGLLGRLDPQVAVSRVTAPPDLLPRALAAARGHRRTQRRRRLLAAVAAAVAAVALAATVGVGVHLYDRPGTAPAEIVYTAMEHAGDYSPVEAEIGIGTVDGATVVAVRCRYHASGDYQGSWPVWLVLYPRDESAEPMGSWFATPGRDVDIRYVTSYAPDEIMRIELQDDDQSTLAWWTP
jgi:hypothetical protein